MNIVKTVSAVLGVFLSVSASLHAEPAAPRKVLVVMSGADHLSLREGGRYKTGYFLNELAVPLKQLIDHGYVPVFASPDGKTPVMDENSNNPMFFAGDETKRQEALTLVRSQQGLGHPQKLSAVLKEGVDGFAGVFIPGGHAPMEDLSRDKTLGHILMAFHEEQKPTGIICHGPVALLSALPDPGAFQQAIIDGDTTHQAKLIKGWSYSGYRLTAFSTAEEQQIEGAGKQLGGNVRFYAADALAKAGARVETGEAWKSKVVVDRELVTGQQPFSDESFGRAFIARLEQSK
ncbi:type 1 glutamine amidotransferase domain-containing protein [Pseudomonas gingeri]|uniref:type 1 glutamine amidotransferase domain-containing protein n=1 Tax=Pseudomonas gingeri TaxID=117681 RepID=UPI0015BFC496|nr:type 1 glutamine amidotransferase domain-containing protein [Pseudomonas gingeri]NWE67802.1 type 1 glutamine amidotransferase domain-containing protein [Pseudomonas gingeri]